MKKITPAGSLSWQKGEGSVLLTHVSSVKENPKYKKFHCVIPETSSICTHKILYLIIKIVKWLSH